VRLAITLAVCFGFTTVEKAEEWRTKHLRSLHLVAGSILLLLCAGTLVSPWMDRI
jgi:hypothetical protein